MRTPTDLFSDHIGQTDGITIALNCALCGQLAQLNHSCTKRYLRNPAVVLVRCLVDPSSDEPDDLFLIRTERSGEEYTTTRAVLKRDYEEL